MRRPDLPGYGGSLCFDSLEQRAVNEAHARVASLRRRRRVRGLFVYTARTYDTYCYASVTVKAQTINPQHGMRSAADPIGRLAACRRHLGRPDKGVGYALSSSTSSASDSTSSGDVGPDGR